MKKEDFFAVLGELNDDIVAEAGFAVKKRPDWKLWGSAAACLVLIAFLGVWMLFSRQGGNLTIGASSADAAPMVYVGDTLYIQSSDQQGYPKFQEDFLYLGQIASDITNSQSGNTDGVPKENFQANHPIVGCPVYRYGENIVVKINGVYWLYWKYGGTETTWNGLLETEPRQADPRYKN